LFPLDKKAKQCGSYKKAHCKEWLLQHPITNESDLAFLLKTEQEFRDTQLAGAQE